MEKIAVIKTGGKQYLVKEGDVLLIEKLEGQPQDKITFSEVLLWADLDKEKVEIGSPFLKISVEAEILAQKKGKKIEVVKYKPKTRYHKKQGHRQLQTEIKIIGIKSSSANKTTPKKTTASKKKKPSVQK
ncbi:50S ribosomal protein L21 [Patescibacteria group bacterium]|nr:50S ribosomal protein L21 [Patescibacteria group bacterium]